MAMKNAAFYDVRADPYELRNLASDASVASKMRQLRGELLESLRSAVDRRRCHARRQGSRSYIYRSHAEQRSQAATGR